MRRLLLTVCMPACMWNESCQACMLLAQRVQLLRRSTARSCAVEAMPAMKSCLLLLFLPQVDEEKRARFKARKEQEVRLPGGNAAAAELGGTMSASGGWHAPVGQVLHDKQAVQPGC